jgi:nitroreductase
VVIAIAARHLEHAKAMEIEDVEAVAAGVQNLLLGAHALGLGAYWRTGDAAYDPRVKAHFGLAPEDHLVGFVYLGYPAEPPKPVARTPAAELVQWRGWEE